MIQPYGRHFNDVLGDSNCGFKNVVVGLGLGKEAWPQIRADILSKLQNYHEDYTFLYDILEVTMKLVHKLSPFDGSNGPNKYMTLLDMKHIIASKYIIVVATSSIHSV